MVEGKDSFVVTDSTGFKSLLFYFLAYDTNKVRVRVSPCLPMLYERMGTFYKLPTAGLLSGEHSVSGVFGTSTLKVRGKREQPTGPDTETGGGTSAHITCCSP